VLSCSILLFHRLPNEEDHFSWHSGFPICVHLPRQMAKAFVLFQSQSARASGALNRVVPFCKRLSLDFFKPPKNLAKPASPMKPCPAQT
jgi:hypothetical protein